MADLLMPQESINHVRNGEYLDEYAIQALAELAKRDIYLQAHNNNGPDHLLLGLRGFSHEHTHMESLDDIHDNDRPGIWLPSIDRPQLTDVRVAMAQDVDVVASRGNCLLFDRKQRQSAKFYRPYRVSSLPLTTTQQLDGNSVYGFLQDLPQRNFMTAPPQLPQSSYNFPGPRSGYDERNSNGSPIMSTPAGQFWLQQQPREDLAQQRNFQQQIFLQQQYGQQHQLPPRALWPQDTPLPAAAYGVPMGYPSP
eukprot:gene23387-28307_t